ncbi:MAG: TlpA family protein disulfide reductase [Devosiaceae bacterium]|nr:TlpA family protein disulfide reductase [Devosiaceae bacterium]
MAQKNSEKTQSLLARRAFPLVLTTAALGIAALLWVSNVSNSPAGECLVSAETLAALDEVTIGELAALLPTGTGRGYSDLEILDENGNEITLAKYAGKPVLVNFWATWCGPCREEMPALNALSAHFEDSPFEVLTINLDLGDQGVQKAREFLEENSLSKLPLLADPTFAAFDRLKSSGVALGLPATLLLDGNGCELAVLQGPAEWDGETAISVIDKLIELVG